MASGATYLLSNLIGSLFHFSNQKTNPRTLFERMSSQIKGTLPGYHSVKWNATDDYGNP